jgi:hypothetical protein
MNVGGFLSGFGLVYEIAFAVVSFIIHTIFAFAVDRDARRLIRAGSRTVFVGPYTWAFATFLGGALVAVAYWVVHHSNLRADRGGESSNNGGASVQMHRLGAMTWHAADGQWRRVPTHKCEWSARYSSAPEMILR